GASLTLPAHLITSSAAAGAGESGLSLGHIVRAEAAADGERLLAAADGRVPVADPEEELPVIEADLGLLGLEAGALAHPERLLELDAGLVGAARCRRLPRQETVEIRHRPHLSPMARALQPPPEIIPRLLAPAAVEQRLGQAV